MWSRFNSRSSRRRPFSSPALRERLEDRILFDGVPDAPVAPPDQPVDDPLAPAVEADAPSQAANTETAALDVADRTELVFVDKRVGNYQTLVAELLRDGAAEIYFLDRDTDGLAQIEAALAGRTDVDALHIISHGEQGRLKLGSTLLTQESMQGAYAERLAQIGAALGEQGDILIYGCNFAQGESGAAAADTLARLTGADVAASIDDTGHASRNANWVLELQTDGATRTLPASGSLSAALVETGVIVSLSTQQEWRGILESDGDLTIELIAAPNFIVDSNSPESGPSAAYIGIKVTNTGTDTLTDVFVYAGNFASGAVGIYPVLTNPTFGGQTYSGNLSLVHEGGSDDATRYLGDLAAGESRVQYFLVTYPRTDDAGNSLAGATSDPLDDVVLPYDIWVTADDPIDGGLEAVANGEATLRSEISASANKIWPNTDSKVPNEYLDAFEQQLGWRPDATAITPGAQVQLQGIWYDMGRVIGGYDADGDLLPDYDVWMQPVGDASVFDASAFQLVKSYGVLIVKLNDGTEQITAFEDQLYFKDLPANNTGVVGLVFYEFIATGGQSQAVLSPYQEAASGSGSEKYNGDYGTSGGTLVSTPPTVSFTKDAVNAATEAPLSSINKTGTLEYVLRATNTSTTTSLGLTQLGLPLVITDEVPDGTSYVLGSAAIDNSHTDVRILYSTDDGLTWTTTEPTTQPVTNIQWWLLSSLDPGEVFEVTFQTTVAANFADAILANTGTVGLGVGSSLATDTEYTLIQGTATISGVVFSDDGAGGATPSDGVRGGTEGTLNNINVSLYVDMDGDGAVSTADILWGTATSSAGAYSFANLPDGDFLVEVQAFDPDRPTGYTLTTEGLATVTLTGASISNIDFGFGPVLDVDKNLVGTSPILEGSLVSYTIDVRNLLGDPWGESTGGFISYTAWAGAQHTTLTTTTSSVTNSTNAFGTGPDGSYAQMEFSGNPRDTLGGGTFVVGSPTGNITSVKLLVWGYGQATHSNDTLNISAQTNTGTLQQLGTLSAAQIQSATVPTLFEFDVTDSNPTLAGIQGWTWSDFTALATATGIQIETIKNSGPDRTFFFVDAFGFQIVTDQSVVGTGTAADTLVTVPLVDDYDQSALQFVSASITPTSVDTVNGILTWNNIGALLPGQSETITVTFRALEPSGNTTQNNVSNTATSTGALLGDGSAANSDTDTVLVTLQPTAIIGDRVWLDHDNDAVQDGTEPGLSDVTVILRNSSGTEIARTVTDATGAYQFRVSSNATYTVAIDTATLPGTMNSTTGGNTRSVTIASLANNTGIDFGYRFTQPVIYGNIWHDVDGDGVTNPTPEAGEGGLENVTVTLYDTGRNRTNATATTDAYGNYFIPVAINGSGPSATYAGSYEVRVTTTSMFATGSASQTVDPDATRDNKFAVTITAAEITAGNTLRGGYNFAYTNPGTFSLGDQVFYDWDGDGTFDAGQDEGIRNLTVELYEDEDGDGVIDAGVDARIGMTTTDASGNYTFANLPLNDYIVRVDTADADYPVGAHAIYGDQRDLLLIGTSSSVDFAYLPIGSGSIAGTVWDDRNGDQTQAGTQETGLANVTVSLYADLNGDGTYTLVRSTTTDADGGYSFDALPAGPFRIVVDQTDADLLTSSGAQRVLTTDSGTINVTLTSGAASTGNNFGFAQLGSIGDSVFFDANRNGSFDDFETGIGGVTVRLLDENGVVLATTVTSNGSDGNPVGYYQFSDLQPGEYQVQVVTATLPASAGANTADPDRDGVPSWDSSYPAIDALYPADNKDEGILINYGVTYRGGDIGYEQTGVIGDRVWLDMDGDGVQDDGETGLANVRVTATNGTTTIQTDTNSDGQYILQGLTAGVWTVSVNTGTLPYSPLTATTCGSDNAFTVTVNSAGAVTHIDGVDVTGQTDPQLAVDFGYRFNGTNTISGTVVLEQRGTTNGLSGNPTDTPLEGLTLFLFRSTGELLGTTLTAADGTYSFTNLPADDGTYDYVVALAKNVPALQNTVLTTTAALTPADTIFVVGNTVRQQLSITGSVTGLDFAFESTLDYDYGDLPATYSNTITDSPAGPRHVLTVGSPYLGALAPDADADAMPSPTASSDLEDDGVTFVTPERWIDGTNGGALQVTVNGSGWLLGWIDFDGDGSFSDANELIVNQAVTTGTYTIDFDIPDGTIDGNAQNLFARFRLFAEEPLVPELAFTGTATGGEVEDYMIAVPQQGVTIGDAQVTEGGDLIFNLSLAHASNAAITLTLATADVSATGGSDYETGNFEYSTDGITWLPATDTGGRTVTFAAGVTAIQVRINTTDDSTRESTETFTLSIASRTGPAGDISDTGTGTILDNDNAAPTTANNAVTATEDATFTFQTSHFPYTDGDSDPLVSIRITSLSTDGELRYNGVAITAAQIASGFDVAIGNIGLLTFVPSANENGTNYATFGFQVSDGNALSAAATMTVHVTAVNDAPSVAVPGNQTATAGTGLVLSGIAIGDIDADTGDVTVTLSIAGGTLTVNDSVAGGLVAGDISGNGSGSVTLTGTVSEINATLTHATGVTYLYNVSGTRTLTVAVNDNGHTGVDPSTVGQPATGDGDDERASATFDITIAAPTLSVDSVTVVEGTDLYAVFTVSLSNPTTMAVGVDLSLTAGTATGGGVDFGAGDSTNLQVWNGSAWVDATTATIAAGTTSVQVRTPITDDFISDHGETFTLGASVTSGTTANASASGTGTIHDEAAGTGDITYVSIAGPATVNEGATTTNYTVSLTQPAVTDVTVTLTYTGTAVDGTDFTGQATVTILAGTSSRTFTLPTTNDTVYEGDEPFTVTITGTSGGGLERLLIDTANDDVTTTILDNDTPTLSIDDITVTEGTDPHAVFTLSLSNASTENVVVALSLANGSANVGTDTGTSAALEYFNGSSWVTVPVSGQVTIAAGATSLQVRTAITDDMLDEFTETYTLTAAHVSGTLTSTADVVGDGTILDEDPPPSLSINDVTRSESDGTMTFTVTLSTASGKSVVVDYATAVGSAGVPGDFTATSGSLTFTAGETTQTIVVTLTDDDVVEATETFTAALSNASNATISDDSGLGTITDDDAAVMTIDNVSHVEGDSGTTTYTFTVTLDREVDTPVTLDWETAHDTTSVSDLDPQTGSITFNAGERTKTFDVTVKTDTTVEANEMFFVNLSGLNAGGRDVTIGDAQGLGTIIDDDGAQVSIDDVSRVEGNAGTTTYTFTVSLDQAVLTNMTVDWATAHETTDGSDLASQFGTVTILAGATSATFDVTVQRDLRVELDETFRVHLTNLVTNGSAAVIGDDQGVGTIINDDAAQLTIDNVSESEGDSGATTYTFTVSLDRPVDADVSVTWTTADDSTNATDLTPQTGTVTILAGQSSQTFSVTVNGDDTVELDETFLVNLSNLSAGSRDVTIGDGQGQGTVVNDDSAFVSIDDVMLAEGDAATTAFTFTISLSQPADSSVRVNWSMADVDTNAADLPPHSGFVTFDPGETTKTVTILVSGDRLVEGDETFTVSLTGLTTSSAAISLGDDEGLGTIVNDDNAPQTITNTLTTDEDTDLPLDADDFGYLDADGDPMVSVRITSLPTNGSLLFLGTAVTQADIDNGLVIAVADLDELVFRPDPGEFGVLYASFSFVVSDGVNESAAAQMRFHVNSVNDPPTARDNDYTTDEDQSVGGNVLTNNTGDGVDSDPDGGTLSVVDADGNGTNGITPVSGPANGTVTLNSNGTFTYVPNDDFFGTDSFVYRITDGQGGFSEATVTIQVDPVNDDPTATDNTADVTEDGPLADSGNLLTDDDGDGVDSDIESNPLSVSVVTFGATSVATPAVGTTSLDGTYGTLTIARDGSYTYSLNNVHAAVQALDAGETLIETFGYGLSDGAGGSDVASLVVTIHGVNDAPVADSNNITVEEGSQDNPLGLAAPTDVDVESLTITVIAVPDFGTVTLADGTLVTVNMTLTIGELTSLQYDVPAVYTGAAVSAFTYTVSDGTATVTGSVTITITRPTANDDGDDITAGDVFPATGTVLDNDSDPENDPLIVTQVSYGVTTEPVPNDGSTVVIDGEYGTLTIYDDGSYSYALNNAHPDVVALNGAATLTDTFGYVIADGHGGSDAAELDITIHGLNDAPTATDNTAGVTEDGPLTDAGNVLTDDDGNGVDSDPDSDPLAVREIAFGATTATVPAIGTVDISGQYGTLTIAADGSYTYTLNNTLAAVQQLQVGETLTEVFQYTATDSADDAVANLTITIDGRNDDPVGVGTIPNQSDADSETIADLDVSGFFDDADLNDSLTFDALGTLPPGLAIHPTTGVITGTLTADASQGGVGGVYAVTIQVTDEHGRTTTQTFNWTVTNPAPVATNNTGSVTEDGPIADSGNLLTDNDGPGVDSDPDGDALVVSAVDGVLVPGVGTVIINGLYGRLTIAADGSYTYTLNNTLPAVQSLRPGATLTETFTYTLSDGEGGADTAQLIVTIQGTNDSPLATDDANQTDARTPVRGTVLPNDSDPDGGQSLTVSAVNGVPGDVGQWIALPSGALLRLLPDGTYEYDPNGAFDHLGPLESTDDRFTYTITDGAGGTATAEVVVRIDGVNSPPVAWGEIVYTPMNEPVTVPVLANDTDPNGEPLALILIETPPMGTTTVNPDGSISYQPADGYVGTVYVRYLAQDPHGASCAATLMIVVEGEPAAPTLPFGFDSFNNFSQPRQVFGDDSGEFHRPALLTREIFTLAPEPTFSGYARPGTMIVGRIYDERGVLIGEGFAHTDPGGNWMMQFHGIARFQQHRIEFDYVTESQDIYGYLGLDPSDNSYQAMQPLTDGEQPLNVGTVLQRSPWESLHALHNELSRPLGFGGRE